MTKKDKLEDLYINNLKELTLEKQVKLKRKEFKHFFKPVYGTEKFKVKVGKISIKDQLAAQTFDFKLAPEKTNANLFFLAWIGNRLIKKANPYWDKTETQLIEMMCDETIKDLNKILVDAIPEDKKKTMQGIL